MKDAGEMWYNTHRNRRRWYTNTNFRTDRLSRSYSGNKGGEDMKRKRRRIRVLTVLLLLTAGAAAWGNYRLKPLVWEYAVNRAETTAGLAVTCAVQRVLDTGAYTYDRLMRVERDDAGAILSVEADSAAVNALSAQIVQTLCDVMNEDAFCTLEIPLFNALGNVWLMGRGPRVSLYLQQSGAATVQMDGSFSGAGINQSLHRLELTVTFRSVLMAAGLSEPVETVATYLVAETLVVGTVPDTYAVFNRAATVDNKDG